MSSIGTGYAGEGSIHQASLILFHPLMTTLGNGFTHDAITGFWKVSCLSKFIDHGRTLLLGMEKGETQTLETQGRSSPRAGQGRRAARTESESVRSWTGSLS